MRSLWQRRSLAVGYWHYWRRAVDQRIIDSPFVDQLYQSVIAPTNHSSLFLDVEQYREQLKKSEELVMIPSLGAPSSVSKSQTRTVGSVASSSLSSPKFGSFLYRLVQFQQPQITVELGTSLGVTTLYLAKVNSNNKVYTLEGAESVARVAQKTFAQFHLRNIDLRIGNIDDTLPILLQELGQVDLVYIDANHRLEPTLSYFSQLLEKVHEGSILIFDDIHWSFSMRQAWNTIRSHPSVTLSIDLFDAGIIFFRPLLIKQHYYLKF